MFCIDKDKLNTQEKILSITAFLLVVFAMLTMYFIVDVVDSSAYNKIRVLGLMGWILLFAFLSAYKFITNVCITPATILVLSMFAFSYGQILLFGLGVDYDYFFLNQYYASFYNNDMRVLLSGNLYAWICLCGFCLGILISVRYKNVKNNKNSASLNLSMKKMFLALFFISAIPYLAYNVYLAAYSLSHDYSQSLELTQPAIIRYVGVFFVPSAIGAVISCEDNRKMKAFIVFCTVINCICSFVIGGRSFAFGLIIGLIVILLMNKKVSWKVILPLCVGAFILATISVSVADYRSATDSSSFISIVIDNLLQKNVFIQFLGEAGFSGTSMVWTMRLVQSGYKTFDGLTYVGAIAGLVPSTLDIFGIGRFFERYTQLEGLLTGIFSFNFGVGFSLVAESYLNFKWFGFVIIFLEALLFGKMLNLEENAEPWRRYVAVVMMTVLLSIPRRDIVFLSNQFTLCVIFPYIFIILVRTFFYKDVHVNTCKVK